MQTRRYTNLRYDDHAPAGPDRTEWRDEAACKDIGGDVFFPDHGDRSGSQNAKAICHECPVSAACLEYALADSTLYGIWAGLTQKERAGIRAAALRKGNGLKSPTDVRAWVRTQWGRGRRAKSIARELGTTEQAVMRWVRAA